MNDPCALVALPFLSLEQCDLADLQPLDSGRIGGLG